MVLQKLPITLVLIVRNSGGRLKEVIKSHRDIVEEVVVIDQSSTDGTWEEAQQFADYAVQRRNKGKCEGDRNFAFELGSQPWVLNLDDDEFIDEDSKPKLKEAIECGCDIVWFNRKNLINSIEMPFMGEDQQCRLFKRGSVRWSDKTHTYAEKANNAKALFSNLQINHFRDFDTILATHKRRSRVLEPDMIKVEKKFIEQVREELNKD